MVAASLPWVVATVLSVVPIPLVAPSSRGLRDGRRGGRRDGRRRGGRNGRRRGGGDPCTP